MIALEHVTLANEDHDRSFMDLWIADFGVCALSASDEAGLFEALVGGARSPSEIADELELDEVGVRAVCRALVAMGALSCVDDRFALNDNARHFWVRDSPSYRGHEFDRYWDWRQHERVLETLKTGWAPLLDTDESFSSAWRRGEVSEESARNFTRVMHSMILSPTLAAVRSGAFSGVSHLVDVGGGSGALAAALIAHQPESRATVMDLAPVCAASKEILATTTSGSAVEYFPVSFFDDVWPVDADAFSLSNVLHDWPLDSCRAILDGVAAALAPGQRLYVQEALLDADSCGPRMTALFSLLMQMNHRGQQFTRDGLYALLEERGFCNVRTVHGYSYWSLIVAERG